MRRGLASSRDQARELVNRGSVLVSGSLATKPDRLVAAGDPVLVTADPPRFVSRGGDKLDRALDIFGIAVTGRTALDVGASTGGFTDCLLQRGAAGVLALDVGHGQLHPRVRDDARVVVRERTNVRHIGPADLPGAPFDLVVADVSFISLTNIAAALATLVSPGGDLVVLVKPQFEAGRRDVNRGRGVIRDPRIWVDAVRAVAAALAAAGLGPRGVERSPLLGGQGNTEFLLWARAGEAPTLPDATIDALGEADAVGEAEDG